MSNKPIFMTTKDFAIKLGIQEQKARRWLRQGIIKGKKVVGTWLVRADEINRLLSEDAPDESAEIPVREDGDVIEEEIGDEPALILKNDIEDVPLTKSDTELQELLMMLEKKMGKKLVQDKWQCYKDSYAEDAITPEELRELKKEFILALDKESKLDKKA